MPKRQSAALSMNARTAASSYKSPGRLSLKARAAEMSAACFVAAADY